MDTAINISTNETVNAFEVFKNGSYQNLNRGEWIMPQDSVNNYNECSQEDLHVHHVRHKDYKNKWGTQIFTAPHFAKYPGSAAHTASESEEHKKIKNWLFTKMKNDDLQFVFSKSSKKYKFDNYVKLSELDIDWNKYDIEVHTKGYKTLVADILLQFRNKHQLLGCGIFLEIQLSKQTKKETYDRSFARAMHGYSTAWLFRDDFLFDEVKKDIQLKKDKITLLSFSSELKYSGKTFVDNLKHTVEEQCRYIDEKMKESSSNVEDKYCDMNNLFYDIKKKMEYVERKALKEIEDKKTELIDEIRNLEDNPFEKVVEKYMDDINKKLENFKEQADSILISSAKTIEHIANDKRKEIDETYPRVIDCPKCGCTMIFKVTPTKQKELYDCLSCPHIIWVR